MYWISDLMYYLVLNVLIKILEGISTSDPNKGKRRTVKKVVEKEAEGEGEGRMMKEEEKEKMTKRDREVAENTRSRVKIKSKLTNLMKITRIQGYNGKYGSNPQGIRKISDDLFEFDQIGQ